MVNADRWKGCGWTDGWTGEGLQAKKGTLAGGAAALVQPYRRLHAPRYWGASRVVVQGGAMPIGGLQPASRRQLFRGVGSARPSMRVATLGSG